MKYLNVCLAYWCALSFAWAQVTLVVNDLPADTPTDAELYVSGNFDNWSGGNAKYKLMLQADKSYAITIPKQSFALEYKFTRGSWGNVEKDTKGGEVGNRIYKFGDKPETIYIKILNWADLIAQEEVKLISATNNVSIMSKKFLMPQFNNRKRRIWLYLPPNYTTSTTKFPVIYMHDGQNLFDKGTSFAGEWEVDETLDKLYQETGMSFIVVGIDNGGSERLNEYTPWSNAEYGGGEGEKYMQFIVETLKPYIDQNYRTLPDKQNTALMGSSLGGLISHFGALRHPTVFGKIGVFSPSFWFNDSCYGFAQKTATMQDTKMYFLAGDAESESMVGDMQKMIKVMTETGFPTKNTFEKVVPNGQHNEKLWREDFSMAIEWLFNPLSIATKAVKNLPVQVSFDKNTKDVSLDTQEKTFFHLIIADKKGKRWIETDFKNSFKRNLKTLPKGSYNLQIINQKGEFLQKTIKL
jgi:alpha-glucosidase